MPESQSNFPFPALAALGLRDAAERGLLEFWLAGGGDMTVERHTEDRNLSVGRLHRGLHLFNSASETTIQELIDAFLPAMALLPAAASTPSAADRAALLERLFDAGLAALWELPAAKAARSVVLPPLALPPRRGEVALLCEEASGRARLRQLLYFAGYGVRADFRSGQELLDTLERRPEGPPALMIVDLDSPRLEPLSFFGGLKSFLKKRPALRPTLRMLLMKDFDRPGLDFGAIEHAVRPHARRIFHPHEALLVLLEALIWHDPGARERPVGPGPTSGPRIPPAPTPPGPPKGRNLDELLYGARVRLRDEAPALAEHEPRSDAWRSRMQPFLWLYEIYARRRGSGAILTRDEA